MYKFFILYFLLFLFGATNIAKSQSIVSQDSIDKAIINYISIDSTTTAPSNTNCSNPKIENLLCFARKYLGTRYRSSGTSPSGFDCSGYVRYVFREFGITLPHSSREMSKYGEPVSYDNLQKGDLVFFEGHSQNGIVGHVGIVYEINENGIYFIHASTSSNVVISSMQEAYYSRRYLKAKRIYIS